MRPWRGVECGGLRPALVVLPLLLAGCASTAIQENQAATSAFASREVGQEVQLQSTPEARAAAESNARTLLAEPLTADGAVQIALGVQPDLSTHAGRQRRRRRPPRRSRPVCRTRS